MPPTSPSTARSSPSSAACSNRGPDARAGVRIVENVHVRSKLARWGALLVLGLTVGVGAPARATPANPSDPAFHLQWNLEMIGAPAAWQVATGSASTIAIVDTGVDLQHEDLRNKIVGNVTCIGSLGIPTNCQAGGQDDYGHGTHVAGIAAASTDNGI